MTDGQRLVTLDEAIAWLKKTQDGYNPNGPNWKEALEDLDRLRRDLTPLPPLGPVFATGKSVLNHDLTHATSGVPLYPAFDDAFTQGRVIIAPEAITVTKSSSANPGCAFYAKGNSKIRYWFGHLDRDHPVGTKFQKGDAIGRVAANQIGGGPHVHVGVNVELLIGTGKQLAHHTNYTHGAPTVGEQLGKLT